MLFKNRAYLGLPLLTFAVAAAAASGCESTTADDFIDPPTTPPTQQEVVHSDVAPPPISGGTLLVTRDGSRIVVADPDRDRIVVVDHASWDVVAEIALDPGDEPGRSAEDAAGLVHVALRRGGDIVSIDAKTGEVVARRAACAAPRGIAFDPTADALLVACAGGELVTLPSNVASPASRVVQLDRDLRDVVIENGKIFVSRFRSAEVLQLDGDGNVLTRATPRTYTNTTTQRQYSADVAWRMVPEGDGVRVVHQRSVTGLVEPPPASSGAAYYGGADCSTSIVNAATTRVGANGEVEQSAQTGGLGVLVLPVDMAVSPDGASFAVVAASNDSLTIANLYSADDEDACEQFGSLSTMANVALGNEPIAVAWPSQSELIVQERQPSALVVLNEYGAITATVTLGGARRADTGHQMFHRNPDGPTAISCASCHPEGRDDGHTWNFQNVIGGRRTQSLVGGVMETAPFHWDGDLSSLDDLMTLVFEQRMGGIHQEANRVEVLSDWLDTIPRVEPSDAVDADAVARGEALFFDKTVACASCHSGAALTNDKTVDVGTGKAFQVPSLRAIADRAPYMHDGCAKTLKDRFLPSCGGGDAHGRTSQLGDAQLDDLVAY
ncbi:MAG TPA: c-type cytochrome, partial [Polyangiaceae bacterium]|nr:c-type cytochrome [Polyangiaceae bacterium]